MTPGRFSPLPPPPPLLPLPPLPLLPPLLPVEVMAPVATGWEAEKGGEEEGEVEGEVDAFDPVNSPDVSSIRSATSRNWFTVIPLGLSGCLLLPPSLLSSDAPAMRHCLWRCVRMYVCGCMCVEMCVEVVCVWRCVRRCMYVC